jgi:hypothetical protein
MKYNEKIQHGKVYLPRYDQMRQVVILEDVDGVKEEIEVDSVVGGNIKSLIMMAHLMMDMCDEPEAKYHIREALAEQAATWYFG